MLTIALVGNPNCGKTTLFNALTGRKERVGNWSGVTVEKISGFFTCEDTEVEVVDLPGIYSLAGYAYLPEDQKFTVDYLSKQRCGAVLNVIDASNLCRNLYLTLQLLESGMPVVVVINRIDIANKLGLQIQEAALAKMLGCPVVSVSAQQGSGILDLQLLLASEPIKASQFILPYGVATDFAIDELVKKNNTRYQAISLLEEGLAFGQSAEYQQLLWQLSESILKASGYEPDVLIAMKRYQYIDELIAKSVTHNAEKSFKSANLTKQIDKLFLHRLLGFPLFLMMMYGMFLFAIHVGGLFQDFVDELTNALFVEGALHYLTNLHSPDWLTTILAYGVGQGINTTLTFAPVIGAMFLALSFLEDSGYMARAAFVMDRIMRTIGLPGKSFVPMIVGFGCNVPAIMGTRTLETKRDRILTVLMSPFMSCGARLAIFTVFVAAFFKEGGQNIIFCLYMIGILMALLTGYLLKKTLLKGENSPLILELPDYHVPQMKTLFRHAWHRLKKFLTNAMKLIIPVCIVLAILDGINIRGEWRTLNISQENRNASTQLTPTPTVLMVIGQSLTPIFTPMGITEENWPATVGLLTGVLAKEVVVGTLNSLYAIEGEVSQVSEPQEDTSFSLLKSLRLALASIPAKLGEMGEILQNPIKSAAPVEQAEILEMEHSTFGVMYQRFGSPLAAFAYLLFVLLYFPCIATTAAMVREVPKRWALFSVLWTTALAYGVSVTFYQIATFSSHPIYSAYWLGGIGITFSTALLGLVFYSKAKKKRERLVPTSIVLRT